MKASREDGNPRGFNLEDQAKPNVFIQWKNTDACFDFYYECGTHSHYDGYFAYTAQCPECGTIWEMPSILFPRKACKETDEYWRNNPKMLSQFDDEQAK